MNWGFRRHTARAFDPRDGGRMAPFPDTSADQTNPLKTRHAIHRALLAANTVRDEIAKALQWMVDNRRKE